MSVRFLFKLNISLLIVGLIFILATAEFLGQATQSLSHIHGILKKTNKAVTFAEKHGLDKTIERVIIGDSYRPDEKSDIVIKNNKNRVDKTVKIINKIMVDKKVEMMKKGLIGRSK